MKLPLCVLSGGVSPDVFEIVEEMGLIEAANLQLSSMRVFSSRERFIYDNPRPRNVRSEHDPAATGRQERRLNPRPHLIEKKFQGDLEAVTNGQM
jgi:hypothetical protein